MSLIALSPSPPPPPPPSFFPSYILYGSPGIKPRAWLTVELLPRACVALTDCKSIVMNWERVALHMHAPSISTQGLIKKNVQCSKTCSTNPRFPMHSQAKLLQFNSRFWNLLVSAVYRYHMCRHDSHVKQYSGTPHKGHPWREDTPL